jgi:hypothetical protein
VLFKKLLFLNTKRMLEVLNFRPGEHERKKLKVDSLRSPKSRQLIEDKATHLVQSDDGATMMESLGAEIEGVLAHIESLARGQAMMQKGHED